MIGNSPDERNVQEGLHDADIVYEIPVEFPFTRYMAIFRDSHDTVVGPIRSSRYYFSRICAEWSAIFAHCGGQNLKNEKVLDLDQMHYSFPFWRDQKIGGWINLFTNIEKLKQEAEKHCISNCDYPHQHPLTNFKKSDITSNDLIQKISIKYHEDYIVSYVYHQNEKKYDRNIVQKSNTDQNEKEKIMVSNIILQYTSINEINHDDLGRVDVKLIGEGIAKVFTGGTYQLVKWIKKDKVDQTLFLNEEGTPVSLNQGLTWVHIISPDLEMWFK